MTVEAKEKETMSNECPRKGANHGLVKALCNNTQRGCIRLRLELLVDRSLTVYEFDRLLLPSSSPLLSLPRALVPSAGDDWCFPQVETIRLNEGSGPVNEHAIVQIGGAGLETGLFTSSIATSKLISGFYAQQFLSSSK
jgi:hypothetical protein